jgi:hypothetical protein
MPEGSASAPVHFAVAEAASGSGMHWAAPLLPHANPRGVSHVIQG